MLATWLGAHTMARRLCEAARRRQARVTASARLGRYFDDRTARAGASGPKPAGIPLACASAQSLLEAQGGAVSRPERCSSLRCEAAVCHLTVPGKGETRKSKN